MKIFFTKAAEDDLSIIYRYIAQNDSAGKAEKLLDGIYKECETLSFLPTRGSRLEELDTIGGQEYRQIHFKPYKIIYTIADKEVTVQAILDSRRSFKDLLFKRLTR